MHQKGNADAGFSSTVEAGPKISKKEVNNRISESD